MSEARLKAAFAKFDKDGSGEISASELVSVLLELGKSEEEARDLAGVSSSFDPRLQS
jgi:Ca2+-binding EF-hand superfamily protein